MSKPQRVVIVGAGIAGLAAAVLLERQGMQVKIYDSAPEMHHIGGGLGIWPNGSAVLYKIFGDAILPFSGRLENMTVGTADGEIVASTPITTFQKIAPFPNFFIARYELHQALLQKLHTTSVSWSKRCINFESSEKQVKITFDDGEIAEADVLVGADGINSSIRLQLFGAAPLNYSGYLTLGGILPAQKLSQNFTNSTIAPQRLQLLMPISEDRYYHFLARPFPLESWPQVSIHVQKQIALFAGWSPIVDHALDHLKETAEQNCAHYFCMPAFDTPLLPRFVHQRVALLGDAAHPIGPLLGLGTALALSDADYLAQALGQTANVERALLDYSNHQHALAENMLRIEAAEKNLLLTENPDAFAARLTHLRATPAPAAWKTFVEAFQPGVEKASVVVA